MPDKKNKFSQNKSGRFYVAKDCISCDACTLTAPDHFFLDENNQHAYDIKQPNNTEEEELCIEAMEACPSESIGDDGEPDGKPKES